MKVSEPQKESLMSMAWGVGAGLIAFFAMWLGKPKFVTKKDVKGKEQIMWWRLIIYSLLIAVVVACIVLIVYWLMGQQKKGRKSKSAFCSKCY